VKAWRPHILVACALAVVVISGMHEALRRDLTDHRFRWTPREATGEIVVVAIDSPSIEKIGVWPWPRGLHAELIGRLEAAGARDIVFDVDFSSPSDPTSDAAFLAALKQAGGSVVLPAFKQPVPTGARAAIHVNRPLRQFGDNAWSALVNVPVDSDGLVRRYVLGERLEGELLPSMAAVLAGDFTGAEQSFLIDFGIRAASIPLVSYADVLRGDAAALRLLKDRKIIIGGTALELGDRFSTPNGRIIAGPLLQAIAAESLLQGRKLRLTSEAVTIAAIGALVLLMLLTWRRLSAGRRVAALLAIAAATETGGLLLHANAPIMLDATLLYVAIAAYLLAIALDELDIRALLGRIAERRFQRIAMSLGDGLVCGDHDQRVTVWNPAAEAIFGYAPTEILGKPFDLLVSGGPFVPPNTAQEALQASGGQVMETEGRRKSGETFPLEVCLSGWQGADGFQYGAVLRDISVRKREAERIRYLAEHDSVTGLPNRGILQARLDAMMPAPGMRLALLIVSIDRFQQISDMLGHSYGDLVLKAAGARIAATLDAGAVLAKLAGDEFAVAVADISPDTVGKVCDRIVTAFDAPLSAGEREHSVKVSIGAAVYPVDGGTADDLLGNSHLALYRAKSGKDDFVLFQPAFRQQLEARLTLENELMLALERREFELFYQPQLRLHDGKLVGAEALIRWRHPTRGLVSPGEFIPVVNTSSISNRVALWVLETACRQARAWQQAGHAIRIGVNLSPSQLQSGDLAASVRTILGITGLKASLLELEVTEDILLEDREASLAILREVQDLGVRLVFDDFGTGYASLIYLKKFPLDGLKIDRSFVRDLRPETGDAAIVGSMIELARKLGLSVIAEGIENRETADLLRAMNCQEGQGYHFSRPIPAAEFTRLFMNPSPKGKVAA
jgi:diguanylate cyclase (GGDEF)-like protein/PAS domain S-box-containing protein